MIPIVRSSRPAFSRTVYRSSSVCVGCWPAPSPPFISGTSTKSPAIRADPSLGWRSTSASAYPSTTRTVSASDSPFVTDEDSTVPMSTTSPPRRLIAAVKLIFVRVDGSKKQSPSSDPSWRPAAAAGSAAIPAARSSTSSTSPRESCLALTMWSWRIG